MNKSSSRKPPNPGWFPKGRSGNLKGRPTSSRSKASAFEVLVEKTLTVEGQGGTREITVEEALQQRTYQDALAGKRMAMREVVKWIIKRETWLEKNAPRSSRQMITHGIAHDPDNADAALLLLGIAAHNPERADIGAIWLLILFILVIALLDIIIPGVTPKWAIFAPIFSLSRLTSTRHPAFRNSSATAWA